MNWRFGVVAIALLLVAPSSDLLAQQFEDETKESPFDDPIETDRDSFTPATKIAGVGRLIAESAYTFVDNRQLKETHSFPESLFRYGVTKRLELRLGWNYEVGGAGSDISGTDASDDEFSSPSLLERESRISYGFKFQATEQRDWLPESAFILQASTPTSGATNHTDVVGTYVFGWKLAKKWKFDSAIRYSTAAAERDSYDLWAPSTILKYHITEQVNVHAEYFGIFSTNKGEEITRHYFSPGVHYLITPNVEIGMRVGWGLNDQTARFFSNAGVGLRF